MRDREICVSSFTGTLGQSQPLISRHLAYLRNSGVVEARRDGKWMHYSISTSLDANTQKLLSELFRWMEGQDGLRIDRENYVEAHPHSQPIEPPRKSRPVKQRATKTVEVVEHVVQPLEDVFSKKDEDVPVREQVYEEYEDERYPAAGPNELEDCLL